LRPPPEPPLQPATIASEARARSVRFVEYIRRR
jgi:hypothetical protein